MQNAANAGDANATEDEEDVMEEQSLADVASTTMQAHHVAAGPAGVVVADGSVVNTTRLTGAFVGKEFSTPAQDQAQSAGQRWRVIVGRTRDEDNVSVAVVQDRRRPGGGGRPGQRSVGIGTLVQPRRRSAPLD